MRSMRLLLVVLALCISLQVVRGEGSGLDDWEISLANRQLDLTTHQARQTLTLSLTNTASRSLSSFYVAVDAVHSGRVVYIGAHVSKPSI